MVERKKRSLKIAEDSLRAAQVRQAFYSDRSRIELDISVGDQVLVRRHFLLTPEAKDQPCDKLRPRWYGPFRVLEKASPNAFRLKLPFPLRNHPVYNITAMKKCFKKSNIKGRYA